MQHSDNQPRCQGALGPSAADRVEKLLLKYKSRQAAGRGLERLAAVSSTSLSRETEAWKVVNRELQRHGYQPVLFASPNTIPDSKGHLLLPEASSIALRQSLWQLMEEGDRRETLNQQLVTALATSRSHHSESSATPTTGNRPIRRADGGHMTPDPLLQKLQSQVARLEHENARLKVDLQNRPEVHELRRTQRRAEEAERELKKCKNLLSSEQLGFLQSDAQIGSICQLLQLLQGEDLLPRVAELVASAESMSRLEEHLHQVLGTVYHDSAPRVLWGDSPATPPSGHDVWCEVTWGHVILTLQEWLSHLRGLQDLSLTFAEVCQQLEMPKASGGDRSSRGEERGEERGELTFGTTPLSCADMASLLQNWLGKKGNRKVAMDQAPLAMVKHFQQLFDVPRLEGVYTGMNTIYQQLGKARNILTCLKDVLGLAPSCSLQELLSVVGGVAESADGRLLLTLHRELGIHDSNVVLEKLRLCEEFFPAFQAVVVEIQDWLGVDSLSAITPALHSLQNTSSRIHC